MDDIPVGASVSASRAGVNGPEHRVCGARHQVPGSRVGHYHRSRLWQDLRRTRAYHLDTADVAVLV
jgi:hypothetical protein